MKLSLSDWASIAEVVSGVAVVVTLIFLILGIRENSEITRASMYAEHLRSFDQLSSDIYRDPELTRIYEAWLVADLSNLDPLDLQRLEQMQINMFRTYERAYLAQTAGFYGADESERMQRLTCINYVRAIVTGTSELLDVLMTNGFRNHMSTTCPEVLLQEAERQYRLFFGADASTDTERGIRTLQTRITVFARAHPDTYQIWERQRDSYSKEFNDWFEDISQSPESE